MKENYLRYGKGLTRALRKASAIYCQVVGNEIYISNNNFIVKMNNREYEAIVKPVTKCEAGDWRYIRHKLEDYLEIKLEKLFTVAVKEEIRTVTKPPITVNMGENEFVGYYNAENDTVIVLNKLYDSMFNFDTGIETMGFISIKPIIFAQKHVIHKADFIIDEGLEPIGVVMPIRYTVDGGNMYKFTKSVKAWYKD